MSDKKDKCMNSGCGSNLHGDKKNDYGNCYRQYPYINDNMTKCKCFTPTPTESITVERREFLENKCGELYTESNHRKVLLDDDQAQIKQLKADKVEAVELLGKCLPLTGLSGKPETRYGLYNKIQSYLSRQEQGE